MAATVGGVLQLAYQLPHLQKIGMLAPPRINFKDAGAVRVVKQMAQDLGVSKARFRLSSIPFSLLLASGSSSWMVRCDCLMEFPSGVLGVALGLSAPPSLSKSFASGNHDVVLPFDGLGAAPVLPAGAAQRRALGTSGRAADRGPFQYG
ncbi:lipid II flippase MurJ [Shigella flexneri]